MSIQEYIKQGITRYIREYRERNGHGGENARDEEMAERFWRMWSVEYAQAGDEFLELFLHWVFVDIETKND